MMRPGGLVRFAWRWSDELSWTRLYVAVHNGNVVYIDVSELGELGIKTLDLYLVLAAESSVYPIATRLV